SSPSGKSSAYLRSCASLTTILSASSSAPVMPVMRHDATPTTLCVGCRSLHGCDADVHPHGPAPQPFAVRRGRPDARRPLALLHQRRAIRAVAAGPGLGG